MGIEFLLTEVVLVLTWTAISIFYDGVIVFFSFHKYVNIYILNVMSHLA